MTVITILTIFKISSNWFKQNLFYVNFTKTQFTNFTTKNNNQIEITINYNNKLIPTITYTKFLGLTVDCSLTWINHIDSLTKKKTN
jgi:biopolymer transport protein ExbD